MHRIALLFIGLLIGFLTPVMSQPSWFDTDSITYANYHDKAWASILRETKRSLAEGVDFFYLRSRAGIAAYEQGSYRLAVTHFSKAYQWNPEDEFVRYWYYWSLVKAGRQDEADALAATFSAEFCERKEIRPRSRLHTVSLENQWTFNGNHNTLIAENIIDDGSFLNYRSILKEQLYTAVAVDHALTNKVNMTHTLSRLNIQRTERFESELPRLDLTQTPSTNQYAYFVQARWMLARGWQASTSATALWGKAPYHWVTFNNNPQPVVTTYEYIISDVLAGVSLAWEGSWIRPQLSLLTGFVNDRFQLQVTPQLCVYPFGNMSVYAVTGLTLHQDGSSSEVKRVLNQKLGFKMGPAWLLGDVWLGSIQNFALSEGYVVYNMPEQINGMAGLSVYVPLFENRLDVTARYQQTYKEGATFHFSNTTDYITRSFQLSEANLLIGLTWHF